MVSNGAHLVPRYAASTPGTRLGIITYAGIVGSWCCNCLATIDPQLGKTFPSGVAGLAFGGGRIRILGGHRAFPWHRHDRGRRAVIDPMFINVILQRLAHRLTPRAAAGPDVVRLSFSPEMSRHMPPFRLSVHSSRPVQAAR